MERSTIFNGKIHYKWPFSIAILVHQRVIQVHFQVPDLTTVSVAGLLVGNIAHGLGLHAGDDVEAVVSQQKKRGFLGLKKNPGPLREHSPKIHKTVLPPKHFETSRNQKNSLQRIRLCHQAKHLNIPKSFTSSVVQNHS